MIGLLFYLHTNNKGRGKTNGVSQQPSSRISANASPSTTSSLRPCLDRGRRGQTVQAPKSFHIPTSARPPFVLWTYDRFSRWEQARQPHELKNQEGARGSGVSEQLLWLLSRRVEDRWTGGAVWCAGEEGTVKTLPFAASLCSSVSRPSCCCDPIIQFLVLYIKE